ncbi:MAG: phosphate ABC transporter substrate-binding protein PstS [Spirochaetes bacterium]|nr:phosphate ABC transporter substrate-binding protein PstS [Spirochaetota bacterium]
MKNFLRYFILISVSVFVLFSFFAGKGAQTVDFSGIELLGAGASFPAPLYERMLMQFNQDTKAKVTYNAIGSSGGIKAIKERTVDFGGTDAFLSDKEMSEMPAPVVHIPTCLGAIVVSYNLPGNPQIKLDGDTIAQIFLGNIKNWNDPKIKALNPDINFPNLPITVAYRSDGSGTTYNFTAYLSLVSSEFAQKVGKGKTVNWPTGVGGPQNAGVASIIKQTEGAIGYVEIAYAINSNLPFAIVKNKAGNWIKADLNSTSLSANIELPADTRIELVNTSAQNGYPITTFTWLVIYKEQNYNNRKIERAKALVSLLWWMTHDGQKFAPSLLYAPLPEKAISLIEKILKSVTFDGKPLL